VTTVPARILVVDDTEISLQLTSYVLRRSGHAVLLARDGHEALGLAASELPDLILTDLQMSGMGGTQLCRALTCDARLAGIPRVAVTAYAMVGTAEEVLAQGFHGYIPKPIEVDTFVRQIEEFLPAELRTAPGG
jgi:two-component system cell cycle response regulator DivK